MLRKSLCRWLSILGIAVLLSWPMAYARAAIYPAFIDGSLTLGDAASAAPYPLAETFNLSSRPSASKTIFLDFNGYSSVGNSWGHNILFPGYDLDGDSNTFSDLEREEIQKIFQNVAEDFIPFNVNVTTRNPGVTKLRKLGTDDIHWGVRVVMTQATAGFGEGIGGDSGSVRFDDDADNPIFVFNKGDRKGGQTATHEAGHTFGLGHDGVFDLERHPGTGGYGRNSWGPIMGAPFQVTLSQWSNGDYEGSTNTFDDFSYLTSRGFGFRTDDYLTSLSTPHVLDVVDRNIFEWGIIENRSDKDFFQFTTETGEVSINVNSFAQDANLDVAMTLYDSQGTVIVDFNETVVINAFADITLPAGDYVLVVDGDNFPGRYSDYGSVGFYTIDIDLPLFADLNNDGTLDAQDWQLFVSGSENDLNGLSTHDAYLFGDLNLDGKNDLTDFGLFKEAFITAEGSAAFASLFAAVPEPTTIMTLAMAALVGFLRRNQINQ